MSATSAFIPQSGAMAMRASERHIDRMAPERDAARRSRSLSALGFSDRVLGPYVSRAQQSPLHMFGGLEGPAEADTIREREIEPTSWLFPRPWYLDELGWLQSTRLSAAAAESAARGAGVQRASLRGPAGLGPRAVAPSASAMPAMALELVAPSFGRAGSMSAARQRAALAGAVATAAPSAARAVSVPASVTAQPAALRAWSPLVAFPAVQAAELMAGVLTPAARAADAGDDVPWQEARPAPAQELVSPFVAPRELVAPRLAENTARAASPSNQSTRPKSAEVPEALRNRLQNALRRLEAQRAQSRAAASAPGQPAAAPSARAAVSGARPASTAAPADVSVSAAATTGSRAPAAVTAPATPATTAAAATTVPVPARERALELMLHSALAGRAAQDMAPVSGPRLALPAGLGGLIAGLRAARTVSRPVAAPSRAAAATELRASRAIVAPGPASDVAMAPQASAAAELPLVGGAPVTPGVGQPAESMARAPGVGYGSAYRAVAQTRPAALAHIAWSDRWLARFAGASTQALAALEATTSATANTPASRAFSGQAPEPVFLGTPLAERAAATRAAAGAGVSPADATRAGRAASPAVSTAVSTGPAAVAGQRAGAATAAPALAAAPRIADDAVVSDEMFAAIAAAAVRPPRRPAQPARGRDAASPSTARATATATPSAAATVAARAGEAPSLAAGPDIDQVTGTANHVDRLLAASPAAPGPGMRVALAASPVAPALSALVPLPLSPSFDVRAMHGMELASAYLAGVIEPGGVAATAAARSWPMLSPLRWQDGGAVPMQVPSAADPGLLTDLPVVAPAAAGVVSGASADAGRPSAAQRLASGAASPAAVATTQAPSPAASAPVEARRAVSAQDRARPVAGPGPLLPAALPAASAAPAFAPGAAQLAADRATSGAAPGRVARTGAAVTQGAQAVAAPAVAFSYAPGSAAAQAESWATVREQHAADLALDYVSPELLVAAQAYGFGPAQAAQAARLSSSGRTGLAALAAAVDLRFIDAFAAARTNEWPAASASGTAPGARPISSVGSISAPLRASGVASDTTARGVSASAAASAPAAGASSAASTLARAQAEAQPATSSTASTAPSSVTAPATSSPGEAPAAAAGVRSFGMPARAPRGAFLWPHATIMAMNLQLAEADAAQPLSLTALDLLAANAVAQMGALVAADQGPAAAGQQAGVRSSGAVIGGRDVRPAVSAGAATGAGQGQSPSPSPLRAGQASAMPLAPDVLAAVAQRDSLLAASAPPATYVTPVLDFDIDLGRTAGTASPGTSVAGMSALGARAARTGSAAAPDRVVEEGMADTPAVAAAALGHRSSLPAGFEALYVALSRSPAGRSLSPAVRAARALALAGSFAAPAGGARAGAAPTAPGVRARAAAAWAAMPTVLTGGGDAFWSGAASADALAPASAPDMPTVAGTQPTAADRSERQLMTARAGESLHSFVAPGEAASAASTDRGPGGSASSAAGSRNRGAVQRAPTAAQPLVQPARAAESRTNVAAVQEMIRSAQQKRSTGDNSIPAWFEDAARRMFQDSSGGGISLAEMTLVTAAPARLVAASPKSASSASSQAPAATGGSESHDVEPTANVEQIARDVYAEICRMIEMARSRNGNTWR